MTHIRKGLKLLLRSWRFGGIREGGREGGGVYIIPPTFLRKVKCQKTLRSHQLWAN